MMEARITGSTRACAILSGKLSSYCSADMNGFTGDYRNDKIMKNLWDGIVKNEGAPDIPHAFIMLEDFKWIGKELGSTKGVAAKTMPLSNQKQKDPEQTLEFSSTKEIKPQDMPTREQATIIIGNAGAQPFIKTTECKPKLSKLFLR